MSKILTGTIVSTNMTNTALVEVVRRISHPLYKKILKRTKKHKVDITGKKVAVGDVVHIKETRPISKDKHFVLQEKKEGKKK